MDIWSWISELPDSNEFTELGSTPVFVLASSEPSQNNSTESIQLRAERTHGSNSEALVTFSVCLQGFHPFSSQKTLWVSDTCPLSSEKPFLPLLLQLLQEIISCSPTAHNSTCPRSQLQKLRPEPISWIMDSHSHESFSGFFNLVFITRMFWPCVCDSPSQVGSLYFQSLLAPNLETLSSKYAPVLRTFLLLVGVDAELCFMRTLGYILAKWCILREVGVGLQTLVPLPSRSLAFAYATESHGFWVLKCYAPVMTMKLAGSNGQKTQFSVMDPKESVLRYTLAHQQVEAVIQLEYSVGYYEGYIQVHARVDNIRIHVVKLGFNKNDEWDYSQERHFPSRARIWVGPEVGATYVDGLSLGRSTNNGEREVETQKVVKGSLGKSKISRVKATATTSMKSKTKNWRMDQDVEGNAAIFDVILYDNVTGQEVVNWKSFDEYNYDLSRSFRRRYKGANRSFTKMGGVVFGGNEYGEEVGWRLSKEMEGSVLKWRIGGEIWVSYWPNEVKSSYVETRRVEWCDEVDLPLIPCKFSI
ncbi:Neuronal PAS domain protein [Quillaja saponaria]|uniref:Neuronal PAS domain protein n=1 Tax=Quillaja saponaria TaxID=32244 RepID=A0AAD7KWA1_QUISA|nr:Neuronal PAS domain protein [Quillaja saponaria]